MRPLKRRRGISLVEIGMAFAILGLALLPIIGLFSQAGRQARQTADYTLAIALESKMSDEMRTASWEDRHYLDEVDADPALLGAAPVVDSRSPFFDAIEDSAPPYGRIEPGTDQAINPSAPALFRQLKSFRAGGRLAAAAAGAPAATVAVDLGWTDFQNQPRTLAMEVGLPRYGTYEDAPGRIDARLDDAIRALLFPGASGPLPAVVAAAGGDLGSVRGAGALVLAAAGLDSERALLAGTIAAREAAAGAPGDVPRDRGNLARALERRAAVALTTIVYLTDDAGPLAGGVDGARLGAGAVPLSAFAVPLASLRGLRSDFDYDLARAIRAYAQLYNAAPDAALPPRGRLRCLMKYFDLVKLALLTTGGDLTALTAPLETFAREQAGRNPNLERFARRELDEARSLASLRAAYPRPRRLAAYAAYGGQVVPVITRLLTGGAR